MFVFFIYVKWQVPSACLSMCAKNSHTDVVELFVPTISVEYGLMIIIHMHTFLAKQDMNKERGGLKEGKECNESVYRTVGIWI